MSFAARIIAEVIARERGYVNRPDDSGGATRWGITEEVARENGYAGPMETLPRPFAEEIYWHRYIFKPGFHLVAFISEPVATELVDTGVNMGQATATIFLQRWLTALNRGGKDYPDIVVDGICGNQTREALTAFLRIRDLEGERVLVTALNCSQGARYLDLAEAREKDEAFLYGWIRARVAKPA